MVDSCWSVRESLGVTRKLSREQICLDVHALSRVQDIDPVQLIVRWSAPVVVRCDRFQASDSRTPGLARSLANLPRRRRSLRREIVTSEYQRHRTWWRQRRTSWAWRQMWRRRRRRWTWKLATSGREFEDWAETNGRRPVHSTRDSRTPGPQTTHPGGKDPHQTKVDIDLRRNEVLLDARYVYVILNQMRLLAFLQRKSGSYLTLPPALTFNST